MYWRTYIFFLAKGTCSPRTLAVAISLAVIAALPFFLARPYWQPGQYSLQIQLTTDTRSVAQVYFDLGKGYSDVNASRRPLEPKSLQAIETVPFSIPTGRLQRVRIDPIDRAGKFVLGSAKIVNASGQTLVEIPAQQFRDAHDMEPFPSATNSPELRGFVTKVNTDQYTNPRIDVPLPRPLDIPPVSQFGLANRVLNCLPVFSLVLLGTLLSISAFAQAYTANKPATGETTGTAKVAFLSVAKPEKILWFAILGLVLFKLWLVGGQTVHAIADAPDDDQLFVNLANSILGGRWLGNYDTHTLMKGPMYSLFIAGVFLLGIPLFAAQHLLYATGCALVIRAFRPFRLNPWLLFVLFAVLLFNPVTYETSNHTRVLRQHLLAPLALTIFASGIGLFARRQMCLKKMLPWALLGGVSLPVFWMTREEGVWILPACVLLWGILLLAVWRDRLPVWKSRLALCCFPFVMFTAGIYGLSWLNYIYYDAFTTCEVKQTAFKAAYGSLLRITPKETGFRNISIHREMIERAYAISPAFASLRSHWDGREGEISDANFIWDLRNAVFDSGIATNGRTAMKFYATMAHEINDACDRGLIKAGGPRSGFIPAWTPEFTELFPGTARRAGLFFVTFDQMRTTPTPSVGPTEDLARFVDVTRSRITPPEGAPPIPRRQRWLDGIRNDILTKTQGLYQRLGMIAAGVSIMAFLGALGLAVRRRTLSYFLVLSTALFGTCGGLVLICALVDTISFPAINAMYFSAGYGLWLLFLFTSWIALIEALRARPFEIGTVSTSPAQQ